MSITWGNWNNGSGPAMRIGFDISATPVTNASTSITWTIGVWTQNQAPFSGVTGHLNYYNDLALFVFNPFTNNEGTSPVFRENVFWTYTYSTFGSSPGTLTFSGEVHDGMLGAKPFVTVQVTIPPRPSVPPAAPSAVVLTRNSDVQATLTWTRNATTAAPYTNQTIQMRRWDGATAWTDADYVNIVSASGTATSYIKTGLAANHAYQMRIRAENNGGSSAWVDSGVILMTPAAPTGVISVMNGAGSAITTTWTDQAYTYPSTGTWKIQRSVSGGAFADIGTVGSKTPTSYTDSTANTAVSNAYRVAAVVGALQSAYATGNTVSAATPPLAPTLLTPNGSSVDFVNDANTFYWWYNPGPTGALQTHFTVETSVDSGANWVALAGATNVASGNSQFTIPAGTLLNGVPYLWRVRTEGVVSAGYGPNSASAAVTGSTKPTVTLLSPTATTNTLYITARWAYAQAELYPQAAWQALLFAADGTTLLEEQNGYDAADLTTFTYVPITGNDYVVSVRVLSSVGIWSNYATITTSYILLPPADVTATGEYHECTGTVLLHLYPTASVVGVTVDIASIVLERRVEGGEWVILAEGLLVPTDFQDGLPMTNGVNEYRITAVSLTPSRLVMPILVVLGTDGDPGSPMWAWVSYGDNFEFDLRVHGDLQISETSGRVKTVQHFLGRDKPVALVGQNTDRSVSVGGKLFFDQACPPGTLDDCRYDTYPPSWKNAGLNSEVVCYRDYTGRRFFGALSNVTVGDEIWPGHASVSYSVTEVDFTERYIQLVVV